MSKKNKLKKSVKSGGKKNSTKVIKEKARSKLKKSILSNSVQINHMYSQEERDITSFIKFGKKMFKKYPDFLKNELPSKKKK